MRATGSGTRTFRMEMHSTGTRKAARSSPSFHAPSSIGSVRSRYSSGGTSRKELGARSRLSVRGHARESLDVVSFHRLTNTTTVTGYVVGMNESGPSFTVEARSGDKFECFVGENTWMKVVHNLDGEPRISRERRRNREDLRNRLTLALARTLSERCGHRSHAYTSRL